MVSTTLKAGTLISLIILVIAFYYRPSSDVELKDRLQTVLNGLVRVENQYSVSPGTRVAVGYGACKDLFVDGKLMFKYTDDANTPEHFDDINTQIEVLKTYAYFFRHGAAAERYITNSSLFSELVGSAAEIPGAHYALGGNAPVMATRFVLEGCNVVLAAKMTPQLQEHLPRELKVVGGDVEEDDIHLIMEYKAGETWGRYTAPRANRFIVHNDANNPLVRSLEPLDKILNKFAPHLLVISGLQMMDNFPYSPGEREERLDKIMQQMKSVPRSTLVHFEMASFAEPELLQQLTNYVVPYADSLGMNEQELPNLLSMLKFGNLSLVSDSNPRVASVLDQMRQLYTLLVDEWEGDGERRLSRIHVHTLAYQAILTAKEVGWKNSMAAAAKASLTAHRHVCGTPQVNVNRARLLLDDSFSASLREGSKRVLLDNVQPVSCWEERLGGDKTLVEICVAPVLVCTKAHQTAGGGDNISAAGLVLQI